MSEIPHPSLKGFLKAHKYIKNENNITHTRIPNKNVQGGYGGTYSIPES